MNDIEKRDRLATPESEEHHWGECFIAVRDGDMVRTLSGIAFEFELEFPEEYFTFNSTTVRIPMDEITVRVRFRDKVVEEFRPYDGGVR